MCTVGGHDNAHVWQWHEVSVPSATMVSWPRALGGARGEVSIPQAPLTTTACRPNKKVWQLDNCDFLLPLAEFLWLVSIPSVRWYYRTPVVVAEPAGLFTWVHCLLFFSHCFHGSRLIINNRPPTFWVLASCGWRVRTGAFRQSHWLRKLTFKKLFLNKT